MVPFRCTVPLQYNNMLEFCQQMYTTHNEVVSDEEYLRDYYPFIVRMKNRGGMTLVSKKFFSFGLKLLDRIRNTFNKQTIAELGTACVDTAYKELHFDEELRDTFLECTKNASENLTNDVMIGIYEELLLKTFHARIGAETAIFKDENTSRFAVDAVDTALREGLKSITKRRKKGGKKGIDE